MRDIGEEHESPQRRGLFSYFAVLATGIVAFIAAPARESLPPDAASRPRQGPMFKVPVAGRDVGMVRPADGYSEEVLNRGSLTIWLGARAAYGDLSDDLRQLFEVIAEPENDQSDDPHRTEREANRIGRKLIEDPSVLAVIGHGTSTATGAAAHLYAQARIPLLMPSASSAQAALSKSENTSYIWGHHEPERLPNCFRLIPSDDQAQAPAMAYLVEKYARVTGAKRVTVITDPNAKPYASDLAEALKGRLLAIKDQLGLQLDEASQLTWDTAKRIEESNPDVLVFCGYRKRENTSSTPAGEDLLKQLFQQYKGSAKRKPKIIMSEACQGLERLEGNPGFEIATMFPIDVNSCMSGYVDKIKKYNQTELGKPDIPLMYELYGYDAVLVLSEAIRSCKDSGKVSRECVLQQLDHGRTFPSACFGYSFVEGENIVSGYYEFSSTNMKAEPISPQQILRMRTLNGGSHD